jgi:hypothetical protein
MGRTSIDVDHDVHGELKKLKVEHDLKKMGDVVRMLVDHYQGPGLAVGSDEDEVEDAGEPVKRRRIDVREPLYSLEILAERPGMLEYYTGFDRPTVDLLIRRFSEVRLERVFFPLLLLCQEASRVYGPRVLFLSPTSRSSNPKLLIGVRATTAIESSICPSESSCSSLG